MTKQIFIFFIFGTLFNYTLNAQVWDFKNMDFELLSTEQDSFVYWKHNWNFPATLIHEPGAIKEYNVHLQNLEDPGALTFFRQEIELGPHPISKLKLTGRFKTLNIDEGIVHLYAFTKDGDKWMQYNGLGDKAIISDTSWVELSTEIWVHEQADHMTIGLYLRGKGEVIIDYLEIKEVPVTPINDLVHQEFMQENLSIIMKNSLYKESLDSLNLASNWKKFMDGDTSRASLYKSYNTLLKTIDHHSFHIDAAKVKSWENTSSDDQIRIPQCTGKHIDSTLAYIYMPGMGSGDELSQQEFAQNLQNLIDSLDHPKLEGWIFDIRENTGGNCWPMLVGIGPILGEGEAGYFLSNGEYDPWIYKNGQGFQGEYVQCKLKSTPYKTINPDLPVAVLVSKKTGSSGEIMAVSFKNRAKSILIGTETAAYSTGNVNHQLSDQSMLFLASSVYCDRKKIAYKDGIAPDIYIKKLENEDNQLSEAIKWLRKM